MNESIRANVRTKNLSHEMARKLEPRGYSEISAPTQDVLHQFEANLAQLEDLHGRLRFVMNEVRTFIRR